MADISKQAIMTQKT